VLIGTVELSRDCLCQALKTSCRRDYGLRKDVLKFGRNTLAKDIFSAFHCILDMLILKEREASRGCRTYKVAK